MGITLEVAPNITMADYPLFSDWAPINIKILVDEKIINRSSSYLENSSALKISNSTHKHLNFGNN
ncbi:hypothetical protein GK047_26825 [Paenibacillus sp. SYP-B3998]|uniref:Uncharacterized protein n=1 Tax=Paenibacillus sp. SYP-B3998 TaxID=2678564 RepID=A0A6G4A508_9BACL|nr:hypothetical protein [Paenibacillus sp. SYP-B3998]NEW09553.1 hypothetical protein [Paenibacillus sp. SYP-B3998]